jgi:serine/threonine protein kinase
MALTSGTRLGPYEIESALGAGGMGEVCAHDARLNRDVAIKILPASFSADPDSPPAFRRRIPRDGGLRRDSLPNALRFPSLRFSADGKSYAYSLGRMLSDLYVVDGPK